MTSEERDYVGRLITAGLASIDVLDRLIQRETKKRKQRKLIASRAGLLADVERCRAALAG